LFKVAARGAAGGFNPTEKARASDLLARKKETSNRGRLHCFLRKKRFVEQVKHRRARISNFADRHPATHPVFLLLTMADSFHFICCKYS